MKGGDYLASMGSITECTSFLNRIVGGGDILPCSSPHACYRCRCDFASRRCPLWQLQALVRPPRRALFGAVQSGLGLASAAGGKYGGRKVLRGNIFGYHLWPRASTRLKPRSITSVCLPESRYEGLSTTPSHGHVRNDLPSKFTSAVNSSPAALSPRSLPTSKSNQKRVNVHCYGNEHCWLYLIDPLDGSECLVGA